MFSPVHAQIEEQILSSECVRGYSSYRDGLLILPPLPLGAFATLRAVVEQPVQLDRRATRRVDELLMMPGQLNRCALIIIISKYRCEADPRQRTTRPFYVVSPHENVEIIELSEREISVYQEGQRRTLERHRLDTFGLERPQDRNELRRKTQAPYGARLRAIAKVPEHVRRDAARTVASEILIHQWDNCVAGSQPKKFVPVRDVIHESLRLDCATGRRPASRALEQQRELGRKSASVHAERRPSRYASTFSS